MLGAPTFLPAEFYGLVGFILGAMDQGSSSACVGFAIVAAVMIRLRAIGAYLEQASPMAAYAWARMMAKVSKDEPLTDDGSIPRLAMQSIRENGLPAESVWPFDYAKINDELPWNVQQASSVARIDRFFRLDSDGIGLVHDIMNACAQYYPVVFGTFVDTGFMRIGPATSLEEAPVVEKMNTSDPRGGGHMLCIVGYRTNKDGKIEFLILNSWGASFGYGGLVWMHEDVILSSASSDFYAMQVSTAPNAKKPEKEAA